jgi:hypothetical protein
MASIINVLLYFFIISAILSVSQAVVVHQMVSNIVICVSDCRERTW